MPILLAMSCLQGRTQDHAFEALTSLPVDGLQLTPGNLPSEGFRERVAGYRGLVRLHHGFDWTRYRRRFYDRDGYAHGIARDHSVHPPTGRRVRDRNGRPAREPLPFDAETWLERARSQDLLVETMYPGELLGTGEEIERALDVGLRLAVDVSHLFIQRSKGALSDRTLERLLGSPQVEEIHVSENDGRLDLHRTIHGDTYLIDWARERARDLPVVLESYWHRATATERQDQLALLES